VGRVRGLYPALADGYAYLDGAAGTQVPQAVVDAIAGAYRSGIGNVGGAFPASGRSDELVAGCRRAVADLVGGQPEGVVLGPNMTTLTYRLATALAAGWRAGDEVVVSRLDHDANVRPWVQAAAEAGASVRWAEFDRTTGDLPTAQYADLVGPRTRLVAVTAGSNAIGTMPDVPAIAARARAAGALLYVDGVHATPHAPTDVAALGADFYVTSAYKWSGPHLSAVAADPALWERMRPAKLLPSPDAIPERFEYGTLGFELLAGITAAVDHLAGLDGGADGDRRCRLVSSLSAARAYEEQLFARLMAGLAARPHVTVLAAPARRCPTVSFRLAGQAPAETARALGDRGVCVFAGDYYAYEYFQAMGLRDTGGAVRASIYHYNTADEVDLLLAELDRLRP
jgi:cysteine desulfurase family protein (TIGR01976 family)